MKTITLKRAISLLMVPIFLFATYFSLPASAVLGSALTLEEAEDTITLIHLVDTNGDIVATDTVATTPPLHPKL